MQCPSGCGKDLVIAERLGVEIDYCPQCRGVWLDRGELDKILDRVERETAASAQPPIAVPQTPAPAHPGYAPPIPQHAPPPQPQPPQVIIMDDDDYYKQHGYHKKKKRKGILGEIFDFD